MENIKRFFFINIINVIGFSFILPLFPSMGLNNTLSETKIYLLKSIFSLSRFYIFPFLKLLIKKFSRIKFLYFSLFFEVTILVLYIILSFMYSFYEFIISKFIIRTLHGCLCGIINALLFSLTKSFFNSEEIQKDLSDLEIGWCIEITAGPIFTSVFYKLGVYYFPFLIVGLFLYTSIFLSIKIDKRKFESYEKIKKKHFLLIFFAYKDIILILGLFYSEYLYQSIFYPYLINLLYNNLGLSLNISNLFFIIISMTNSIILKYLVFFIKKYGLYGTSFIGLLLVYLGALMIYLYPSITQNFLFIFIGLILIGGGGVLILIPGLFFVSIKIKNINFDKMSSFCCFFINIDYKFFFIFFISFCCSSIFINFFLGICFLNFFIIFIKLYIFLDFC